MNLKRLTAIILVLLMTLTLFTGCKSSGSEESAAADTFIEGEQQNQTGDGPVKVEKPNNSGNTESMMQGNGNNQNNNSQQGTENNNPQQGNENNNPQQGGENVDPDTPVTNDPGGNETPDTTPPSGSDNTPNNGEGTEPGNNGEGEGSEGGEGSEPGEVPPSEGETVPGESGTDPNLEGVEEGNFLKIVAYNIRCANDGLHESNGYSNNIEDRGPRFKALMDELQPDIMALSEASKGWIEYLQKNIEGSKYIMLYTYRAEDSLEAQPLIYDYTKFDLLDDGYFWLSETPNTPSKGWGGKHYRGVTWAHLKVKATGRQFVYYSTHLTGSDTAVIGSCDLIVKHATTLGAYGKIPVFVSGDFNTEPWTPGYTEFATYFTDFNDYLGFDQTYTNGGYVEKGGTHIIDYVFGDQEYVVPTHYEVLHRFMKDGYISDHKGIYAECYIK